MVVSGLSVNVSERALALARTRPELRSTAGIHPHEARTFDARSIERLRALARDAKVVAIGECGLDFDRDFSPRDAQRRCFEAQLELAAELRLPVFLHDRAAHDDFLAILTRHRASLVGGVIHCFTGRSRELDAYLALDMHIGITGWITDDRRGAHLRELVGRIPHDRLMIETDAPFLVPSTVSPRPSGRRNEPAFLPHVLRAVARATGETSEALAARTTRTARTLFGL